VFDCEVAVAVAVAVGVAVAVAVAVGVAVVTSLAHKPPLLSSSRARFGEGVSGSATTGPRKHRSGSRKATNVRRYPEIVSR
jgi:hypothetical protein